MRLVGDTRTSSIASKTRERSRLKHSMSARSVEPHLINPMFYLDFLDYCNQIAPKGRQRPRIVVRTARSAWILRVNTDYVLS